VGICSPLQWRNRPGFSPGSLTLDCIQGEHSFASFKERDVSTLQPKFWQEKDSKNSRRRSYKIINLPFLDLPQRIALTSQISNCRLALMTHYEARFNGITRLFGTESAARLQHAHVCVIGIGGVGSWAVEALVRSGIGEITLVDLDDVCISNANRQLHALTGTFGKPKVEVMSERVLAINPDCKIHARHEFFVQSNAADILTTRFDYVVEAIDSPSIKSLLVALCVGKKIPIIVSGAAGGRRDPTQIDVADLVSASNDRLLREVRRRLRQRFDFPRGEERFGVEAVFSREVVVFPQGDGSVCAVRDEDTDLRIDCNTGLGTASFVTGVFGMVAASRVVQNICGGGP
jgi:tRNA threonylcarbamoyladenosine dehydratase